MTIYFAQATNGGPIKIGCTMKIRERRQQLGQYIPGGVEIIAEIPGGVAREHALHYALSAFKLQGEWYPACAPIWRVIIEAIDAGDLGWLPHPSLDRAEIWSLYHRTFKTITQAAKALGLTPSSIPSLNELTLNYVPASFIGRLALYTSTKPLPAFLRPGVARAVA